MVSSAQESFLGYTTLELQALQSYWTAREISQQPDLWIETNRLIQECRGDVLAWLGHLFTEHNLRIVFTGAGSSAMVGSALAPWLARQIKRRCDAVATTDLVSDPLQYLPEDIPTLLVSFARSGNSPESVAGVKLVTSCLSNCKHLIFTCNPDGQLAQHAEQNSDCYTILMPAKSDDRSLAMTSSFTSMLVAAASLFTTDDTHVARVAAYAQEIIELQYSQIRALAQKDYKRVVVLGAGGLSGIAREAALKCLELSDGQIVSMCDTPLGFRHGPKAIVDQHTLVILFASTDPYTHRYDQDLTEELEAEGSLGELVVLSADNFVGDDVHLDDMWLSLLYLVYCQILAFSKTLQLSLSADNPSPGGAINRVVQGVTIYSYPEG